VLINCSTESSCTRVQSNLFTIGIVNCNTITLTSFVNVSQSVSQIGSIKTVLTSSSFITSSNTYSQCTQTYQLYLSNGTLYSSSQPIQFEPSAGIISVFTNYSISQRFYVVVTNSYLTSVKSTKSNTFWIT
jgi:hypothetical protein